MDGYQLVLELLRLKLVKLQIILQKQSGVTSLIGIENLDPILEKIEINDVWVLVGLQNFIKKMEFIMQNNLKINLTLG